VIPIVVVDYGVGNIRNVVRGLEAAGGAPVVTSAPATVAAAARILLPGVGAFRPAAEALHATGLGAAVASAVRSGATVFGICLGMQLLFEEGDEFGRTEGLGLLAGRIERLPSGVRTPHVGWNTLKTTSASPLMDGARAEEMFYFVHSYAARGGDSRDVLATTETDGFEFPSVVGRGRIFGAQFHPEKSDLAGIGILRNFLGIEILRAEVAA